MNLISIQSWVAYGHVGNSSAMFPLQRLGCDASHAWVSLYIPNIGWKGFDPTNAILPNVDHVRVARPDLSLPARQRLRLGHQPVVAG